MEKAPSLIVVFMKVYEKDKNKTIITSMKVSELPVGC